jgi:hypothetical protein
MLNINIVKRITMKSFYITLLQSKEKERVTLKIQISN